MHILGENLRFAFTVPLVRLTYDARFLLQTALLYETPTPAMLEIVNWSKAK
jgi:hypothetical protein